MAPEIRSDREYVVAESGDPVVVNTVSRPAEVTAYDTVVVDRVAGRFDLATVLGLAASVVLIAFGVIAVARGDLNGPLMDPVVSVAGWDHTPLLGLIEIGAGVLLLLASFDTGTEMVVGATLAMFGVICLIEPNVLGDELTIEGGLAWLFVLLGGVPFVAAAVARMAPIRRRRRTVVVDR